MSIKRYLDRKTAIGAGFSWSDVANMSLKRDDGTVCTVYLGRDDEQGLNLAVIVVPKGRKKEFYFARLAGRPPEQLSEHSYQRFVIELDGSINETNRVGPKALRRRVLSHSKQKRVTGGAHFQPTEADKDWYGMPNDSEEHKS